MQRQMALLALVFAGCAAPNPPPEPVERARPDSVADAESLASDAVHYSLDGFEASEFCAQMRCRLNAQYGLRTGGTNNQYDLEGAPYSTIVEVTTSSGEIFEGSLGLLGSRDEPSDFHDMARLFVEYFVRAPCPEAMAFIAENSAQNLSQLEDAPSVGCNGWEIRTGRAMMIVVQVRRRS